MSRVIKKSRKKSISKNRNRSKSRNRSKRRSYSSHKKTGEKLKLISIKKSPKKDKKLVAKFSDGKEVHFGYKPMSDFTKHKDEDRKNLYILRHRSREHWDDPQTRGSLSRYILWNKKTLKASIEDYKKRFKL